MRPRRFGFSRGDSLRLSFDISLNRIATMHVRNLQPLLGVHRTCHNSKVNFSVVYSPYCRPEKVGAQTLDPKLTATSTESRKLTDSYKFHVGPCGQTGLPVYRECEDPKASSRRGTPEALNRKPYRDRNVK